MCFELDTQPSISLYSLPQKALIKQIKSEIPSPADLSGPFESEEEEKTL